MIFTQHASAITVLTGQHNAVNLLFGQLEKLRGSTDEKAESLAQQVVIALMKHAISEQVHLYPAARKALPGGDAFIDQELEEHVQAERTMQKLESLKATDAEFWPTLYSLMDEIRMHVREEENHLFPALRRACSEQELLELGEKILKTQRTAPTRPHPASPQEGGALQALAPGAGLVDRLRDALTGRGG